ncbi:DUF2231 domain-containing protein [Kordiimonas sp.]|uniref:DUF2231 domain-containing protein n=1 Tax=Kordiimonas sp. TaxID=1970157 RepID=UPI003A911ABD
MTSLIEPNLHPVLVHFAYALPVTATAAYWLGTFGPERDWKPGLLKAADWMLAFGALAIIVTIAAGFQAYYTVGHDGPSHAAMTTHRNWAVPTGLAMLALVLWRWKSGRINPKTLFLILLTVAALALTVTAWWGGRIVYGYGLGVKSLPEITGGGHDHDHGEDKSHDHTAQPDQADKALNRGEGAKAHEHDNADEKTDVAAGAREEKAHDDNAHDHGDAHNVETLDAGAISNAFYAALKAGDEATVARLLADDVLIIEGGHAQTTKAAYMSGHMKSDMAFLPNMESKTLSRETGQAGDRAWVVTHSRTIGNYRGQEYNRMGREFMLLRQKGHDWKIELIEWADR